MTVGQILLELDNLNDEELDNLAIAISIAKKDRDYAHKEEAVEKLKEAWDDVIKAWDAVTALGITICDNEGFEIKRLDDDFLWRL